MADKEHLSQDIHVTPDGRRPSRLPRMGVMLQRHSSDIHDRQNHQRETHDPSYRTILQSLRRSSASSASSTDNGRIPRNNGESHLQDKKDVPSPSQKPAKKAVAFAATESQPTAGFNISSPNSRAGSLRKIPHKILKRKQPEVNMPAETGSFAEVAAAPPPQDGNSKGQQFAVDQTKTNGRTAGSVTSEETLGHPDQPSVAHDYVSYASALKTRMDNRNGEHLHKRRAQPVRSGEESDPDLDDMGMEEVQRAQKPRNKNGGIRWAPWDVPLKRRVQTTVVLIHCLGIVLTVSLFFGLCANPFTWPLLLIYLLHVLTSKAATDGSLRYRWEWARRSYWWHLFAGYFPATLHKTCDLPPTRKYIFGYHPHGIISHGAWAAFATEALGFSEKFPGITNSLLTLDSNFRVPFYRDYILAMGVRSVSKESIINILTRGGSNGEGMGRGVTIVVGGARESLEAQPGNMRLILQERKGFIKIAIRTGADLVPVLCFGENDLYDQLPPREHPFVHQIQMFILKVWKFTLPFMHGRGIFNYDVGLMPYRRPMDIVVGAPIKVEQSMATDQEYVDQLHDLYVEELEKLWDRYKDDFAKDRKEEMRILP